LSTNVSKEISNHTEIPESVSNRNQAKVDANITKQKKKPSKKEKKRFKTEKHIHPG